jgi:hypothetical protein
MLRPMISRPTGRLFLVSSSHLGFEIKFLLLSQLRFWRCGVSSLTRGRVCGYQLLLVLAKAVILGFQSCGAHDHILISQIRDAENLVEVKAEVEVNLRPTVSRQVCLGVRRPSGTSDQFFFLLEISSRPLRLCYFVAPSLTRGRVCNLLFNYFWSFLPEHSLLCRSPTELTVIFYCLIWDSPNLEGQVPVFFILQKEGGPVIPSGTGFPFCRLLWLAGLRWRYSNPPPHGEEWDLSTISYIGIQFCTSEESHYVILTRLHTEKSEIFLLYHI